MKPALLIIDVQTALCSGGWAVHDIDRVVDRINAVSAHVRKKGGAVIVIQFEEAGSPVSFGSDGWKVYGRLETQAGDRRLRKAASDAFHKTYLLKVLQAEGIGQLIICGLQSELCVDSTVRGALAHDYPVIVVADAHSTLDNGVLTAPQISAHHNVTWASLAGSLARIAVMPADQLLASV